MSDYYHRREPACQASAENGHILLDGKDLPVYVHPDGVNYEESILDPIDLDSHKKILSVKNFTVDQGPPFFDQIL